MERPKIKRGLLICLALAAGANVLVFAAKGLFFGYAEGRQTPDPRSPTRVAASKPAKPTRPKSTTWEELVERNASPANKVLTATGISTQLQTVAGPSTFQYEKGRLYDLYLSIAQLSTDFILASRPTGFGVYALVVFREDDFDEVTADKGDVVQATAKFTGYRMVEMVSGASERYPAFELVGMKNLTKGSFHSFE